MSVVPTSVQQVKQTFQRLLRERVGPEEEAKARQLQDYRNQLRVLQEQINQLSTGIDQTRRNAERLYGILETSLLDTAAVWCRIPANVDPDIATTPRGVCTDRRLQYMAEHGDNVGLEFVPQQTDIQQLFVDRNGKIIGFVTFWQSFRIPPGLIPPLLASPPQTMGGIPVQRLPPPALARQPAASPAQVAQMTQQLVTPAVSRPAGPAGQSADLQHMLERRRQEMKVRCPPEEYTGFDTETNQCIARCPPEQCFDRDPLQKRCRVLNRETERGSPLLNACEPQTRPSGPLEAALQARRKEIQPPGTYYY